VTSVGRPGAGRRCSTQVRCRSTRLGVVVRLVRHGDSPRGRAPVRLPAAMARHAGCLVHVIDGDGASLCEAVAADDMVVLGNRSWNEIDPDRRCAGCAFIAGA
jgi:hypothetical protein